ncbi:MAG TPA: DEAD/DEAH box helicase [Vicinamibacterales bacterium]|nr:DEAD/DEAH box helicase [Vicinamibacterales bacterium]
MNSAEKVQRIGQRVRVRGRVWTIENVTPGIDCTALQLTAEAGAAAVYTLLIPFDRPRVLESRRPLRVVRVRRWLHEVRRMRASFRPAGGLEAAATAGIRLLAYQLEPALAALRYGTTRILIADGVGLGKTIQACLLLLELRTRASDFRAIVLTPAGLRDQWQRELHGRFAVPSTAADAGWLRSSAAELPPGVNPWLLPGVYLASHDFVKRPEVLRPLEEAAWDLCVVDEAHAATSRSDRRAAADAIACRSRRVLLLTATPPSDSPGEFDSLCRIGLAGEHESPILMFHRSPADVAACHAPRRSLVLTVRPSGEERRMHDLLGRYTRCVWRESGGRLDHLARLASIVLRKRALSSAGSLAVSVERRLELLAGRSAPSEQLRLPLAEEDPLEDAAPDTVLGAPGLADSQRERRWLKSIAEAAHDAARAETKVRFLLRLLGRLREPVIVFTEYRDTLARLEKAIAATGRQIVLLHGGMTPIERSAVQTAFNERPLTLLATDAAAEGLNLHIRCRLVIHYELPWSAARLEQRAGRVDRFGQNRRAHEIALVTGDTAERLVVAPLISKSIRARTAGIQPATLVRHLTEARVAEMVMSGEASTSVEALPFPPNRSRVVVRHLRAEAEAEARRLDECRRLDGGLAEQGSTVSVRQRAVATRLRRARRLSPGSFLVYSMSLSCRDGRQVCSSPLVVSLATDAGGRVRSARALRELAGRFLDAGRISADRAVQASVRSVLDASSGIHLRVNHALRDREAAIARAHISAARRIVQAGLFDRRTMDEAAAREARRAVLLEESTVRLQRLSTSPLVVGINLEAMLLVARRVG